MLAFPVIAMGAEDIGDVLAIVVGIFNIVVSVIVGFALLMFLWGVAKFIGNADNETARTEGKNLMIWGIVALFVMISVWGLVAVIQETFDITCTDPGVEVQFINI